MATRKRVVVVGGGIAGSLTSKRLENEADVTLIDPKDYFEVPFAALRCLVEPKVAERSVINHNSYLKKAKVVISTAENATKTEVTTATGEKIPFDFLVICTGCTYTGPPTRLERIEEYQKANLKLVNAQRLLIIGGGPVGVELAGEIVVDYPKKKVTIVTSSSRLIEFLGPKASQKCLAWLKSKKVDVLFNDSVDPATKNGTTYTTRQGKKVEADIHFWCIGKRLGNTWLQNTELQQWLDDKGHLKVDATMRLQRLPNIFAAGDMTDIKEMKQGYLASLHAGVVTENIKKLIKDPNCAKLSTYVRMAKVMGIVTLGRNVAVAQFPCCTMLGCLPGLIKGKDLFIGKTRQSLGLKAS